MTDVLTIFLLIGVAHYSAHVIECNTCQRGVALVSMVALEMMSRIFGWPIFAIGYVVALFSRPKMEAGSAQFIEFSKRDGESMEDFVNRVNRDVIKRMEEKENQS